MSPWEQNYHCPILALETTVLRNSQKYASLHPALDCN